MPKDTFINVTNKVHHLLYDWYSKLTPTNESWQDLYTQSLLTADRIESIRNLDDAVIVIHPEHHNNETFQVLGVENKEDAELQVSGTLQEGSFIGIMEEGQWLHETPSEKFNVKVPSHHIKYLSFKSSKNSGENIVFHSIIVPHILEAKTQPSVVITQSQWSSCNRIDIFSTTLILKNFNRYSINNEKQSLTRQLMYAQGLVKRIGRDFNLKFFYIRGEEGIGNIDLRFKDFFIESIEQEELPKSSSEPIISEEYREHINLQLGEEIFNLALVASEFFSTHHVTNLQHHANVRYQLRYPGIFPPFPDANIFSYVLDPKKQYSSISDLSWLPIDQSMSKYELPGHALRGASYYLDPETGDLYLTRITLSSKMGTEALLVKFPNYKCNWQEFQQIIVVGRELLTIANRDMISLSAMLYSGPSILRIQFDYEKWLLSIVSTPAIVSIEEQVNSNHNQVVHFDVTRGNQHHSFTDLQLWDLRDRFDKSSRAKTYDYYLLKEAINLCDHKQQEREKEKWKIPSNILKYATGYYSRIVSTWTKGQITPGTKLLFTANDVTMSMISSQGTMFASSPKRSGYHVHFSVVKLYNVKDHILFTQTLGEILCTVQQDFTLKVKKVDESQYENKNIFIVAEITNNKTDATKLVS